MATAIVERMAVEIDGEGDAVLMLHGLGGTSNTCCSGRSLLSPTSSAGARSGSQTTPTICRGPSGATTIEPGSTAIPCGTR